MDVAGNIGELSPPALVRVRFVALGRKRILTKPGSRFAVLVVTDAPSVSWRLAGKTGTAARGTLHLVAPGQPGRYPLVVRANGHAARALVIVRGPTR